MAITTVGSLVNSSVTTSQSTVSVTTVNVGDLVVANLVVYGNVHVTGVVGGNVAATGPGVWTQVNGPAYNATLGATVAQWVGTVATIGTATITLTFSGSIGSTKVQRTITQLTAGIGAGCEWHLGAAAVTNTASTTLTYPSLPATCAAVGYFPYAPNGAQASTSGYPFAYVGYCLNGSTGTAGSTSGFAYTVDTNGEVLAVATSVPQNTTAAPAASQSSSTVSVAQGFVVMPYLAGAPFLTQAASGLRVAVEIAWGANLADLTAASWDWTDVTGDVLMDPKTSHAAISITLGSPNEAPGQQTQASEMTATLLNTAAQYSLGGQSPNWPNVQRNTPVRVRICAAAVWSVEYQGQVVSLQPGWDDTGRWATVHLTASGPLRRINQGTLSTRSVMRNYVMSGADATVTNYWPFEEPATAATNAPLITNMTGATQWYWLYSQVTISGGVTTVAFIPATTPSLTKNATSNAFPCSAANPGMPQQQNTNPSSNPINATELMLWSPVTTTSAPLPAGTVQVAGNYIGTSSANDGTILWAVGSNKFINGTGWTPNTSQVYVEYTMDPQGAASPVYGNLSLVVGSTTSTLLTFSPSGNFTMLANVPFRWRLSWNSAGGNTTFTLGIIRLGDTTETTATTTLNGFTFNLGSYTVQMIAPAVFSTSALTNPLNNTGAFGHLTYHNASSSLTAYAPYFNAHTGESVVARLTRLCAENNIPALQVINSAVSETSTNPADTQGYQWVDSVGNLLRESEATGVGTLYDGLGAGLTYVTRQAKQAQQPVVTLDASAGDVAFSFEPVDDDQGIVNDYTATQRNGPSVSYQQLTGPNGVNTIGDYQSSMTVNVADTTALTNYAQWGVNTGSPVGYRYPSLQFALEFHPDLIPGWLNMFPSGRLDVTNITSVRTQMVNATIPCMVQGWTETIDLFTWRVNANCSPYDPWRVITLAANTGSTSDTTCWLDTDGSALAVAANAGDTTISVTSTGPRWVVPFDNGGTDNYPFTISLGGVQVQVTTVTGIANPQVFTVSPLPQAFPAGTPVAIWDPPVQGI